MTKQDLPFLSDRHRSSAQQLTVAVLIVVLLVVTVEHAATLVMKPLAPAYYQRLRLDPTRLDTAPILAKLQAIQEAHLATIPFENTAQHGVGDEPACLEVQPTAHKILVAGRGGFCFELNGLLSHFLQELGFSVIRVPAAVCVDGTNYPSEPTHMILIVTIDNVKYFVDVGFGEPPMHPLRYDLLLGQEQVTPEGMYSKLVRSTNESDDDTVQLYWKHSGKWMPRLKWDYKASIQSSGPELSDFEPGLDLVLAPDSSFSRKLIVCRLTRQQKLTLAGNVLKITGPPRFPVNDNDNPPRKLRQLESEQVAREVLRDMFGQPWAVTEGLELTKSKTAGPSLWSHQ